MKKPAAAQPSFFSHLFLELDGKPSLSRVLSALTVLIALGLICFLTIRNRQLPDHLSEFALVITGILTATYGANKIADAVQSRI